MIVESNAGAPFGLLVVPRSGIRGSRINLDVKISDAAATVGPPSHPAGVALRHAREPRSRVERVSTDPRSEADVPRRPSTIDPATARHLHHLLATEQRRGRLPSVAAGIVRDGALVWSDAIGTLDGRAGGEPADTDTQYRMGSITKTFVAVAVMRLRDAGRLDLLDRFEDHVPGSRLGRRDDRAAALARRRGAGRDERPVVGADARRRLGRARRIARGTALPGRAALPLHERRLRGARRARRAGARRRLVRGRAS